MKRVVGPPLVRFWMKVDDSAGDDWCWLWLGGLTTKGYGSFTDAGRISILAHRFAYEQIVGPVPDGMELDHLCRVRSCVNPAHLEPVTHAENVRRGDSGRAIRERTHCPVGHPYEGDNLGRRSDGYRQCRTCRRERQRERRAAA